MLTVARGFVVWTAVALVLAAAALAAQEKPDFSGRWILVSPSDPEAEIPRALSVGQLQVHANARGESMPSLFKEITVEREFHGATRSETHPIGVQGGFVPGRREDGSPAGERRYYAAKWEGTSLVFETASDTGASSERREAWSLEPDGRLRVLITTRSSTGEAAALTLLYRRR